MALWKIKTNEHINEVGDGEYEKEEGSLMKVPLICLVTNYNNGINHDLTEEDTTHSTRPTQHEAGIRALDQALTAICKIPGANTTKGNRGS